MKIKKSTVVFSFIVMLFFTLLPGYSLPYAENIYTTSGEEKQEEAGYQEERKSSEPAVISMFSFGDNTALANDLIDAISKPDLKDRIVSTTYEGNPDQAAVMQTSLQEFPRSGNQYVVLSTGRASNIAGVANTFSSVDMGGVHIPGGSPDGYNANDVATLTVRLDLTDLTTDPEPRLVFRYKFMSEEPPSFWGSPFQDYFTAWVKDSEGNRLENIALLPNGNPFTIDNARPYMNQVQGTSQSPIAPFPSPNDVVYNATTGIHTTHLDLTDLIGQEIELEFQIGDVGDSVYDSAVFIDGLEIHAGPLPDFWVNNVEFNQVTQSIDNNQTVAADQLVASKRHGTTVRVYVVGENNEEDPQRVSGELHLYKDGNPVIGSPFSPLPRRMAPVENPSRTARNINDRPIETLQFYIPRSATATPGNYQFYIDIDPAHEVDEVDKTNNRFPETGFHTVTYHDKDMLDVLLVRVTTVDGDGNEVNAFTPEDESKFTEQRSYVPRLLPRDVSFRYDSLEWNLDATSGWLWWKKNTGDLSESDGRSALFSTILDMMEESTHSYHTVVAMVPSDTELGANGWGYTGRPGAIVSTRSNSTLTHEIAHNWLPPNMFTTPGDENHDYTNSAEDGLWAGPLARLMLNKTNILHRGTDDPWVSPISYQALFENFALGSNGVSIQQKTEIMRITGWDNEDGELVIRPIFSSQGSTATANDPDGIYLLELLDENDNVLESLRFHSQEIFGEAGASPQSGPFSLRVPRPDGLRNIVFRSTESNEVLGSIPVSEHSPTVSIQAPTGGESVDGTFTVEWEGNHPEDVPLFYNLMYSHDGENFQVLKTMMTDSSFELDTSKIPGGPNAVLRLVVSDGVNTASVDSPEFSVATKAPETTIVFPSYNAIISVGDVAAFEGEGYDLEDGELFGNNLEWSSSIDGFLGVGEIFGTTELSEGKHTITLTATDIDGNVGSDSISLTVVDTTPDIPTGLEAIPGNQQVTLNWDSISSEYTEGYKIYWGNASGVYGGDINLGNVTSHTITGLTAGTTYYFAVTAYDAVGNESGLSSEVSATPFDRVIVPLDVLPGSIPNPLNLRSRGVLPVAIVGTTDFDVTKIDLETVRFQGVEPLRRNIEDVATPYNGEISDPPDRYDGTNNGPDGINDLALKFDRQEIIATLGNVKKDYIIVVEITGQLKDGTDFVGYDVVWIR